MTYLEPKVTSTGGSVAITYGTNAINLEVATGSTSVDTLSDDVGTVITPAAGNIQLVGHVVEQGSTKFSTIVAGTNLANINPMSASRWIVDSLGFNGTHTTIAAAITSATSGDTIEILPGTYTGNLTLKAGVNLTAWGSDSSLNATGKVIISGTCTLTTAGSVTISGIQLQTNSADLLDVTGTLASIVNLQNCYLNCTNNTGITFSSSSASSAINIDNCYGNLGTTGIKLFAHSGAGSLSIFNSDFTNTGASTTASTISGSGLVACRRSVFFSPITSSSTSGFGGDWCGFNCSTLNTTALTLGGSGSSSFTNSNILGGSASAVSISNTTGIYNSSISSSNTNAITGAGTIQYSGLSFTSSSTTINTTTQTIAGTLQGSKNTAPTAGFIGEQIRSTVVVGSPINLLNNTVTNITSISLTPGVWDVSAVGEGAFTGVSGFLFLSVNSVSATLGTRGDNSMGFGLVATAPTISMSLASYRVTVSTTTTYFMIMDANFTTGACTGYGRISATRVG